jgi:hypothetical protein
MSSVEMYQVRHEKNPQISTRSLKDLETKNDELITSSYTRMDLHWRMGVFSCRERRIRRWGCFRNI